MSRSAVISDFTAAAEIPDLLQRALREIDKPSSASAILKQLKGVVRIRPEDAEAALQDEVREGRLWEFPLMRGQKQYWHQSPVEYARACLAVRLQGSPETRSVILKAIEGKTFSGLTKAVREQLLDEMIESQKAFEVPPLVGERKPKSPRIAGYRPDPSVWLRDAFAKLSKTLNLSESEILKYAQTYIASELSDAAAYHQPSPTEHRAEQPLTGDATSQDERLLEAMRTINPQVDEGDMVLIASLRKELDVHMPGSDFDSAVLDSVRRRRFAIHRYDRPNMISEEERARMIRDDDGNFYNTISLWRN